MILVLITSSIYGNRSYESAVRWGPVNGTSAGKRRDLYLGSLHSLSVSDNEPDQHSNIQGSTTTTPSHRSTVVRTSDCRHVSCGEPDVVPTLPAHLGRNAMKN